MTIFKKQVQSLLNFLFLSIMERRIFIFFLSFKTLNIILIRNPPNLHEKFEKLKI